MAEIRGLPELRRELKALPERLRARALNTALRAGAKVIVAQARANAPARTGALRRNIVAKRSQRRRRGRLAERYIVGVQHGRARNTVRVAMIRGKRRALRATAYDRRGEDPWYFRFQELGYTATGRSKRKGRTGGRAIPGRRFLTRAFLSTDQRVVDVVRAVLTREIARR